MSLKRSCEEGPEPKRTRHEDDLDIKLEPESTIDEDQQFEMQFVKVEPSDFENTENWAEMEPLAFENTDNFVKVEPLDFENTDNLTEFPSVTIKSEPSDAFFIEDNPNFDPLTSECPEASSVDTFQQPQTEIATEQTDDSSFYVINVDKNDAEPVKKSTNSSSDVYYMKCYRCFQQNITIGQFKSHLSGAHKVRDAKRELNSFMTSAHFTENLTHQCTVCNAYFKFNEIENHIKNDHKICRICQIPVPKSFKQHLDCEKSFTQIFHCKVCYREFTKQQSMLKHFANDHPTSLINILVLPRDTNTINCPYCFYCSSNLKYLKFHVRLHERKKCGSCKKWFLPTSQHIGNCLLVKCLDCEYKRGARSETVSNKSLIMNKPIINPPPLENDVPKTPRVSKSFVMNKPIIIPPPLENDVPKAPPVSTKGIVAKKSSGKPIIYLSSRTGSNATASQSSERKSTLALSSQSSIDSTKTPTPKKICIVKKQDSVSNPKTISVISKGKKVTLVPKSDSLNTKKVCVIKSKASDEKKLVKSSDPFTGKMNETLSMSIPDISITKINHVKSATQTFAVPAKPIVETETINEPKILIKPAEYHPKITVKDLGVQMTRNENAKIVIKTTENPATPKKLTIKEFGDGSVKVKVIQQNAPIQSTSVPQQFFKFDGITSIKVPLILRKSKKGPFLKGGVMKIARPIGDTSVNEVHEPQASTSSVKRVLIKTTLHKPQSNPQPSTSKDASPAKNLITHCPSIQGKKINTTTSETDEVPNKKVKIPRLVSKGPNIPVPNETQFVDSDSTDSIVNYPCTHCSKLLDLPSLNQHIRLDHFFCGICSGTFDNFMYLQKHYQTCTIMSYKCWICARVVANKMELKLHMSTKHMNCPPDPHYKAFQVVHELFDWSCIVDSCPYCLKSISQFSDFNFHLKMDHEIVKCENVKCSAFKVLQQKCRQCEKF